MPYTKQAGKTFWDNQGASFNDSVNDPVSKLIASGSYRDIGKNVVRDYFGEKKSQEDTIAAITGSKPFDESSGPIIDGQGVGPGGVKPNAGVGTGFNTPGVGPGAKRNVFGMNMTKEQLQAELDHGADPANTYTPETSSGSKIKASLAGPNSPPPVPGSSNAPSPGSSVPGALPADSTATLPFPDVGAPPTSPAGGDEAALNQQYGVDAIQKQMDDLDQQIIQATQDLQQKMSDILGQTGVSTRYSSKEASAVGKSERLNLQNLRAQRLYLTRSMAQATKGVAMIMRANAIDYAASEKQYTYEVSQNEKAQALFDKEQNQQLSRDKAQLTVMMSHMDPTQPMSADERAVFDRLGMSVYGTDWADISGMMHPKDAVYHSIETDTTTGAKKFVTITRDSNGHVSYSSTPIGGSDTSIAASNRIMKSLASGAGTDNYVNPQDYAAAKRDWVTHTGKSGAAFDSAASVYRNPNDKGYQLNPAGSATVTF